MRTGQFWTPKKKRRWRQHGRALHPHPHLRWIRYWPTHPKASQENEFECTSLRTTRPPMCRCTVCHSLLKRRSDIANAATTRRLLILKSNLILRANFSKQRPENLWFWRTIWYCETTFRSNDQKERFYIVHHCTRMVKNIITAQKIADCCSKRSIGGINCIEIWISHPQGEPTIPFAVKREITTDML